MKKIKVLVVDDTALMRKIISDMINSDDGLEVIGTAKNGENLLDSLSENVPDVITLDVEMPKMDGLSALSEMKKRGVRIPVIMLSSLTQEGADKTMECLNTGAFDFLPKPSGRGLLGIEKLRDQLIEKIKLAYHGTDNCKKETVQVKNRLDSLKADTSVINAVVIGASTGGPGALNKVISALPEKIGIPVFVVQHMPVGFTKYFADRLNSISKIRVVEAADQEKIEKDTVYIAPGGYHMEIGFDNKIHLNTDPTIWGVRPAVDKLFISASKVYKENLLSVVLTGMGKDGAKGTVEVKNNDGITIAEDESSCVIYGMPKAAFETGMVDYIIPVNEVSTYIERIVKSNFNRGL